MVSVKLVTGVKSVPAVAVPPATETVTDVAPGRAASFSVPVTVTVVEPTPSETWLGFSDRVTFDDAVTFSVRVSSADSSFSPLAVALPPTVTVSLPSATPSTVRIKVNVSVPLFTLAGMVSVKLPTGVKSIPAMAVPSPTSTATGVAPGRAGWFRVPVTVIVVEPSPSETLVGFTDRVTLVDAVSKSVIVSVAESTASPFAVPLTVSVSVPSATLSSVGFKLKVCVPSVWLAGMVSVKSLTVAKSVPAVAVPLSIDTVTGVALVDAPLSRVPVTVTVAEPAPSETWLVGFSVRVTLVDGVSLSVIVQRRRIDGSGRSTVPRTITVSAPSATPSSVGIRTEGLR